MANQKFKGPPAREVGASSAEAAGVPTSAVRRDQEVKRQRGGGQADQPSGETQKGAPNRQVRGKNPQGNKSNQNQSARQKGKTF